MSLHPALMEERYLKLYNNIHPFMTLAACISILVELGAVVIIFVGAIYDFNLLLGLIGVPISLLFVGFTGTCLLYNLKWTRQKKNEMLPKLRTPVYFIGVLLFVPLIYPGSIIILIWCIFGGFYNAWWWAAVGAIFLIYFHVVKFMILIRKDFAKLLNQQLEQHHSIPYPEALSVPLTGSSRL